MALLEIEAGQLRDKEDTDGLGWRFAEPLPGPRHSRSEDLIVL